MLVALVVCFALAPTPSRAARGNISVSAILDDATVDAGQGTRYRINVLNADADEPPVAPLVDGLTFTSAGQTRQQRFSADGYGPAQLNTTTIYLFNVETTRAGRFSIPGQQVRVGGANLRTLPVALTVLGAGLSGSQAPQVYAELVVSKKSAFVGEGVPIEARVYVIDGATHQAAPDLILNGDGFSVEKFTRPQFGTQIVNSVRYQVDSYKSSVAGLKLGEVDIGPFEIEPVVQLPNPHRIRGNGYTNPFDALLGGQIDVFNLSPPRRMKLDSQAVPLEVKPLPEAGKPADFTGAIGQFKLDAEVSPRQAQTGDPVTVRLRLSGQGNFDRINLPDLISYKGLQAYPATAKFHATDEANLNGTKTFEQVVIADSARPTLPGYHFNYFDPESAKYVTVDTPPESIKIEGPTLATPTPAPVTVLALTSSLPHVSPSAQRASADILYIRSDPGPRLTAAAFAPLYRRTDFWVAQGGALAALFAFGMLAGTGASWRDADKRSAAERSRSQAELQRALRRNGTGRQEFYSAATRLAQLRAGPSMGDSDASLSAADICRLRRLDPSTVDSLEDIFHRNDELAYSGDVAAHSLVPTEERRGVLATLDSLDRQ